MLVEKTIAKYGHDPRTLSHGSHKLIIYICSVCGEEREIRPRYYKEGMQCRPCPAMTYNQPRKPRWKLAISRPLSEIPKHINREETFKAFGYYPEDIAEGSPKKVYWNCTDCNSLQASENKVLNTVVLCKRCVQKGNAFSIRAIEMVKNGFAPNGKPLGRDANAYREKKKLWRRKERLTPKGRLINCLRSALKRVHEGCTTSSLPYTRDEYVAHILSRLAFRNNICPLCKKTPIDYNTCDVDHKIPLSSAETEEEALALFALENLDVLCPNCNQFVKRDNHIEY